MVGGLSVYVIIIEVDNNSLEKLVQSPTACDCEKKVGCGYIFFAWKLLQKVAYDVWTTEVLRMVVILL